VTTHVTVLRRWKSKTGVVNETLAALGYDVRQMNDDTFNPSGADVVWVQGNLNWFPLARKRLDSVDPASRPAVMVWHSEPLPFPRDSGFPQPRLTLREIAKIALRDGRATDAYTNFYRLRQMHARGRLDLCVVSARSRQTFLKQRGIPSHFVPLGYHNGMGERLDLVRDIDVLFIGTLDDSRHRRALAFLRSHGVNVEALGSWKNAGTWGESRTHLINRAKIFLNIQRHAGQFSGYRMMLGMGNGAMVLSEPVHDPFPYEPGVHYVSTPLETMPVTIPKYLADDASRIAIAESGYRFATESLTMEKSVRQVAGLMDAMLRERKA
jgi:hypothetical protein